MIIDSIAALTNHSSNHSGARSTAARRRSRLAGALGAVVTAGLLIVGVQALQTQEATTLVPSVAVSALEDDSLTSVTGQVAEIYGNKFILVDASGRALVETGRAGEDGTLFARDEVMTVQGRFHHGFMHASLLVHADGRVDTLRPPPPHHGAKDRPHRKDADAQGPDVQGPEVLAVAAPR